MPDGLFSTYAEYLRTATDAQISHELLNPDRLLLGEAIHNRKALTVAYAPFDYVNRHARVVIVGLTPGRHQMQQAVLEARRLLRSGASLDQAEAGAKIHASFSGPMRSNLVAMLDHIGLAGHLGLDTTGDLWGVASGVAHFTSALRYPVFVDGRNYSGVPGLLRVPLLLDQLTRWFGSELRALPEAIVVPLGPTVAEAVVATVAATGFDRRRIITGLPHASGANAERIAFFLDRKARHGLSAKVAPDRIIAGRQAAISCIKQLGESA